MTHTFSLSLLSFFRPIQIVLPAMKMFSGGERSTRRSSMPRVCTSLNPVQRTLHLLPLQGDWREYTIEYLLVESNADLCSVPLFQRMCVWFPWLHPLYVYCRSHQPREESDGVSSEDKPTKKIPPPRPAPPTLSLTPSPSTQPLLASSPSDDNGAVMDDEEGNSFMLLTIFLAPWYKVALIIHDSTCMPMTLQYTGQGCVVWVLVSWNMCSVLIISGWRQQSCQ